MSTKVEMAPRGGTATETRASAASPPMGGRGTTSFGVAVSSTRLEAIVKHDGRLDVLCCLVDGGPLGVPQIAARINEPAQSVQYWMHSSSRSALWRRLPICTARSHCTWSPWKIIRIG